MYAPEPLLAAELALANKRSKKRKGKFNMSEIISIFIYCFLGIILMLFGTFVVDLIVPCHFPTEIKNRNVAVGSLMAGISIGIGIIIKSAIMSPTMTAAEESLAAGITSTIYYYVIGLIVCVLSYLILVFVNRKYDLNKEIGEGNPAAGIMAAGLMIGVSIIISGVIM